MQVFDQPCSVIRPCTAQNMLSCVFAAQGFVTATQWPTECLVGDCGCGVRGTGPQKNVFLDVMQLSLGYCLPRLV